MKLKLTRHFQDMISWRGINLDHVKATMREPDEKTDAYDGAIKVKKEVDGKTIEVIYCKENFRDRKEEYLIITAYYL